MENSTDDAAGTNPGPSSGSTSFEPAGHDTVTASDLRRLLDEGETESCLTLVEGRIHLASGDEPSQQLGLVLITRGELRERVGEHPDETTLTEQATLLDIQIRLQGA